MVIETAIDRGPEPQRGLAMVEFTIVLPVLLLLLLVTAEFGRLLYHYNSLTQSVRDGVRYVSEHSLNGTTGLVVLDADLIDATRNMVVYGRPDGGGEPVLRGLTTAAVAVTSPDLAHVTVTVLEYQYQPMIAPALPSFSSEPPVAMSFPLRAGITMRAL